MEHGDGERIEKLMSLTLAEFHKSIAVLAGEDRSGNGNSVELLVEDGTARINYDALPGARLGGLLELPRAKVSIAFEGLSEPQRRAFLARFDLAFRRGGG